MNVLFSKTAWQQYLYWQSADEKIVDKINELIKDIQRNPFKGIGKPEALRQNLSGYWSRRINKEHRLIYRIVGKENEIRKIEILNCKFHY